jgi:hypothetical protein
LEKQQEQAHSRHITAHLLEKQQEQAHSRDITAHLLEKQQEQAHSRYITAHLLEKQQEQEGEPCPDCGDKKVGIHKKQEKVKNQAKYTTGHMAHSTEHRAQRTGHSAQGKNTTGHNRAQQGTAKNRAQPTVGHSI